MRVRAACCSVVAMTALALAGCSGGGGDGGSGPNGKDTGRGDSGTSAAAPKAPAAQDKARESSKSDRTSNLGKAVPTGKLDFSATTLEGRRFSGASLKDRPAVLWFWAPWCGACQHQAPTTAAIAKDYAGKVNVVGVGGLDKKGPMREFVARHRLGGITQLADERGEVWKRFNVTSQSVYLLLDSKGNEVDRGSFGGEADLRRQIDGMLS